LEVFILVHFYKEFHSFTPFFSALDTQSYLKNSYQKLAVEQADQKSYENCYPFIYYLEHAQIYYKQAADSPLLIQPILLFYGFVHLIKACLLTTVPCYPENTSVLAHGVSTRKRKKQQYEFLKDEVKFQKNGLLPCMLENMFGIKYLEGDKATMSELLQQIPELNSLFLQLEGKRTFLNISNQQQSFSFPKQIMDSFHMTENRFIEFIEMKSSSALTYKESTTDCLLFDGINKNNEITPAPLKYNLEEGHFSFPLTKGDYLTFPEIVFHYLLLYNLSMIARYETEWWSELLKTMPNKDYPFIVQFLSTTSKKGPFLAYQYLMSKK
jgi:hypothetical protein